MFTKSKRAIAAAVAGAIGLTAVSVTPASAARRHYNAAGAAAFAAVVGTIATVVIAEQRRRDWENYNRQRAYYGYPPAPPYYGKYVPY